MILIFSEDSDLNTRNVISYLSKNNEVFEIFSENDFIEFSYKISQNEFNFCIYKNDVFVCNNDNIKSVWYRRFRINVTSISNTTKVTSVNQYAIEHLKARYDNILRILNGVKVLGKFGLANFNKFEFLEICNSLNLNIPKTLITKSKLDLIRFFKECENSIITKSISCPFELPNFNNEAELISYKIGYTAEICEDDFNNFPDFFDLSLFQEKIDKSLELRVIYINGECFTQAIFSQSKKESSLDFRLGYSSGMRMCNYSLPEEIKNQVCKLMVKLDLNFGSIDLIVDLNGNYIFLEVNPNGQYGAFSDVINANIDYKIANFLMN